MNTGTHCELFHEYSWIFLKVLFCGFKKTIQCFKTIHLHNDTFSALPWSESCENMMFYPPSFSFPTFYISPGKQTCECRSSSEGYVVTDDAIILCWVSRDTRGVFLFKSFCCKQRWAWNINRSLVKLILDDVRLQLIKWTLN